MKKLKHTGCQTLPQKLAKILPSPSAAAKQAKRLKRILLDAIKEEDIKETINAVVTKAKKGDARSVRVLLDLLNK